MGPEKTSARVGIHLLLAREKYRFCKQLPAVQPLMFHLLQPILPCWFLMDWGTRQVNDHSKSKPLTQIMQGEVLKYLFRDDSLIEFPIDSQPLG